MIKAEIYNKTKNILGLVIKHKANCLENQENW